MAGELARAIAKQKRIQKTAKLGSGARFKAVAEVAAAGGAKNPEAVAAMIGRKKYGTKKMAELSVGGKKKPRKIK
jgi:hypothetical protein